MGFTRTRIWIVGGTAAIAFGLCSTAAQAAVTVGQSPPTAGSPGGGCGTPVPLDSVQQSSTGNSYVIPAGGGVITSWTTSLTAGTLQLRLRVFNLGPGTMTPVGESDLENVTAGAQTTSPTRIPVSGGEVLGLLLPANDNSNAGCTNAAAGPTNVIAAASPKPVGEPEPIVQTAANFILNVAANLEPDADRDGFGDETQDAIFSKTPKKKTKSENATFRFTGSPSFQCRIDKKPFKPCTSPKKLRNLKERKHRFRVQPIDAEGNAGPITSFRWRVVD